MLQSSTLLIAPALGFAGLCSFGLAVAYLPKVRSAIKRRIAVLTVLSAAGRDRLEVVAELPDPFSPVIGCRPIGLADMICIYLNSRENFRIAHLAEPATPADGPAAESLVRRLAEDHRRIRGLLFLRAAGENPWTGHAGLVSYVL